jgi:hypothetical protein
VTKNPVTGLPIMDVPHLFVASPDGDSVSVGFLSPALPCRALDYSVPSGLRKCMGAAPTALPRQAGAGAIIFGLIPSPSGLG